MYVYNIIMQERERLAYRHINTVSSLSLSLSLSSMHFVWLHYFRPPLPSLSLGLMIVTLRAAD